KSAATISPTVVVMVTGRFITSSVAPRVAALRSGRYDADHMDALENVLMKSTMFRRLSIDDRKRLAAVASVRSFEKGDALFTEGDASDLLYTVLGGRVKVFKTT